MANNSTEKFTHIGPISVMSSVIGGLQPDGTVVVGFGYATHQPPAEKRAGSLTLQEATRMRDWLTAHIDHHAAMQTSIEKNAQ